MENTFIDPDDFAAKIFYGMGSFYKSSTLTPAVMCLLVSLLRGRSVPTPHLQPLHLLCSPPALWSSQSIAHLLFKAVAELDPVAVADYWVREKGFLLPTVDIPRHPKRVVCLPFWESVTKAFASFWKANVPGKCKFQTVTIIHTVESRVLRENSPIEAGQAYGHTAYTLVIP